ncbi:tRNA (N6-threonylcarbamoyladenosine(37)-N6)-methyltransferase TrmO [Desulfobacca acetoxidans]|uniref:Uncharacterized protein family UPF0066 n=1 Tax=Desulfobacca acetoxidans (strain ATCC 700848 / DSM 11109 / ASRB2) TaxID=880072 RepID=F2NFL5_DESAR|nr:tRNA (N6-threonylcarbamoyladenosine(37)-N6)-methyltransferase TrmO [Desulfobacca acetoxidans]AEB10134.1 Uncharacterized protein family UPF0066 [Desulfobacca acetoxidans DSM 11109]
MARNGNYLLQPIGWVRRENNQVSIEVEERYMPGLLGLEQHSHLWIIYYFHENETSPDRGLLQIHPRRNPANPLTGVFASRSSVRPNLLALSVARLLQVDGRHLILEKLDARDGAPVLDIKPYMPVSDLIPDATNPTWLPRLRKE